MSAVAVERPSAVSPAVGRVGVGIDAAVSADHHVCVRRVAGDGSVSVERFRAAPTIAGLGLLARRLSELPAGTMVVAEPTSMTWLGLSAAAGQAGCGFALIGARHSSRLRAAIMGKNKSDLIDADVIARAPEVFELQAFHCPSPQELALRRAVTRRQAAVVDANRTYRRLVSLARWAFPDVWIAFAGSMPTAPCQMPRVCLQPVS